MKLFLKYLFCLLCVHLLLTGILHGQEKVHFDRIEKEDGTQLGHVFDIFEDDQGFVWFCTAEGLAKYDGYDFQYFRQEKKNSNSLSSSWVNAGLKDSRGRIWVGTSNGLNLMDRETETFERFYHDKSDKTTIPQRGIRDVFEDSQGRIWVATFGGICLFNETDRNFIRLDAPGFRGERHAANFFEDRSGGLWVSANRGFYKIDPAALSAKQVLPLDLPGVPPQAYLTRNCFEDANGILWISASKRIWQFDPLKGTAKHLELPDDLMDHGYGFMLEYPKGILMIASFDVGLISWDLQKNKLHKRYARSPLESNGLTVNSTYCLATDSRDNLWIGLFHGANKLNLKLDNFQLYQNVAGTNDLRNYTLRPYGDREGGVWLNTMRGVFYRHQLDLPPQAIVSGPLKENQYHAIKNFYFDDSQKLWFGIRAEGVYHYNLKNNKVAGIGPFNKTPGIDGLFVNGDHQNPDLIWVSSNLGLYRFNQKTQEEAWFYPMQDLPALKSNNLQKSIEGPGGKLWMRHQNDLVRFDKSNESFQHYPAIFKDSTIRTNFIDIAYENGEFWWATGNSLNRFDPNSDQFEALTTKDGLLENGIISMQIDAQGDFWMGQNGITQFSPSTKTNQSFQILYKTEGLIYGHSGKCKDGTLLFPTNAGVLAFHPDSMKVDNLAPKVMLRNIKVNNENFNQGVAPEFIESLLLTWDHKIITFEYAGLKYDKARRIQYKIMLEGFDQDWRFVGNKRDATYTNLNPGNYTFKVLAANAEGFWSKEPMNIPIKIMPPYWQTNWFYTLMILVLFTVSYAIFKYYQYAQNLSREKEIAENSARYKSLFLANISHEIRTPMNAIVGMGKLMFDTNLNQKQSEYANIITQSAENLLVIVNDILDHSKIESGKYSFIKKPFELDVLIRQLYKILEIKAVGKNLDFVVEIDPRTPNYLNGDATRLHQILMNLVGNAIKFTEHGQVKLDVKQIHENDKETQLLFAIKDTGIGIPDEKKDSIFESFERIIKSGEVPKAGTGLGLSIARQLVEQQGGKIWLESRHQKHAKPGGTTFFFNLSFEKISPVASKPAVLENNLDLNENLSFLVVEDTIFNQMLSVELLKKYFSNSEIDVAENGQVALEKIQSKNYDLILMDVKMPVMDGIEATRIIKNMEDAEKANTPIIAVTANAIQEQLELCKKVGMDDYITKPINGEDLFLKIVHSLKNKKTNEYR